jgi:formate dehydrogenase subunit gamma
MFVVLAQVHKWTTYVVTALILGHVLVASGILPGYRGVWRSMHLGGRLDARVARRLWPAWWSRNSGGEHPEKAAPEEGSDPGERAGEGAAGSRVTR